MLKARKTDRGIGLYNPEGGCGGSAYYKFKSLKAHNPILCSYLLKDFKPDDLENYDDLMQ